MCPGTRNAVDGNRTQQCRARIAGSPVFPILKLSHKLSNDQSRDASHYVYRAN